MPRRRSPVQIEIIENSIFVIRGLKVMLDKDLAELYGIETKSLKQAVKRNPDRFFGFHVYTHISRGYKLEATNCDLKFRWLGRLAI